MTGTRSRYNRSGFTLFELLVAMSILGIAITMAIQLFSANLRVLSSSERYIHASLAGESKIREILARDSIPEETWFDEDGDGYRYTISVTEVLGERTENLKVTLLNVAVTVFYPAGGKEKSIRINTLKALTGEQ